MKRVCLLLAVAVVLVASAFALPAATSAAVNYFDSTKVVSKTMTAAQVDAQNITNPITVIATCPTGYRVTGGGYNVSTAPQQDNGRDYYYTFLATASAPYSQGWRAVFKYQYGQSGDYAPSLTAYAVCTR